MTSVLSVCMYSASNEPVSVLRFYQSIIMYGRPLNLSSVENTIDGETIPICVNRFKILDTTYEELLHFFDDGNDFRTPLEVTFYDEKAYDLG